MFHNRSTLSTTVWGWLNKLDSRYAVVRFCQSQRLLFLGHPGVSEINHDGEKHCELSLYKLDVSYASKKWSKVTVTLTRILTDRISSNWTPLWLDWWSVLDLFSFVHLCKLLLLACNYNIIFDLVYLCIAHLCVKIVSVNWPIKNDWLNQTDWATFTRQYVDGVRNIEKTKLTI